MDNRKKIVFIGSIISLVILIVLLILQLIHSSILQLESRWLIVAGVPILVSLIVGGYIHKFKGLGIEIETRLQNKIGTAGLQAKDATEQVQGADKGTLSFLYDKPLEELGKYGRLYLVTGRKNYYHPFALKEYLERMINLQFIEVKNENGIFQYLIPVAPIREQLELLEHIIDSLSENKIPEKLKDKIETDFVKTDDKLITILPKIRESKNGWLPVLSKFKRLEGVITKETIEARIADEVIAAKEAS